MRVLTIYILLLFLFIACDKKPSVSPIEPGSQDGPVCEKLATAVNELAEIKPLLKRLCTDKLLETMDQPSNVYSYMNTSLPISIESKEITASNQSEVTSYNTIEVKTSPRKYYEMLNLQATNRSSFDSLGFIPNPDRSFITYEVKFMSGDPKIKQDVNYYYENTKRAADAITVEYHAKSRFLKLDDNSYVVFSRLDLSQATKTLKQFYGVVLITKHIEDLVRVYSISTQIFENQNDHVKAVNDMKNELTNERNRAFSNGIKSNALIP